MALAATKKKLYFDVNFGAGTGGVGQAVATTVPALYFPCTSFTNGVVGDRNGNVLQALECLTGNSPNGIKKLNAVSAWFQLSNLGAALLTLTSPSATTAEYTAVDFVMPTGTVANHANVTRLRSLNTAGTTLFSKGGQEAIYGTLGTLRHFSVRVRKTNNAGVAITTSVRGVLYVARQHSLEV